MPEPVKVDILDREYLIACPEDEKSELLESASLLDQRMKEIRDSGKIVGLERIAVMAALNITHEMIKAQRDASSLEDVGKRLAALDQAIQAYLNENDKPA